MKKLRVKAKQHLKAIINFNVNQIRTDNGIYLFDDVDFEFKYADTFQVLHLKKCDALISLLRFNKNDNIKVIYKEYSKISKFDRNLECSIYKCKDMIERR